MVRAKPQSATAPDATLQLENEIADLTATRTGLAEQLPPLEQAKQGALLERRNQILAKAGETAIADANCLCREAESAWFAIADAIEEADRRLADAIARRDAEADDAEREAVAGRLERNAGEIEAAAAGLAKAIESVARAHAFLVIGISGPAASQFDPVNGVASPLQTANALLYGGLARALPSLDLRVDVKPWSPFGFQQKVEPADPIDAAAAFAGRVRDAAAKVRTQEIDHVFPVVVDGVDIEPNFTPPDIPNVPAYVSKPVMFVDDRGQQRRVPPGTQVLPEPVAEAAFAVGAAQRTLTQRWIYETNNWLRAHSNPRRLQEAIAPEKCCDLQVDLRAMQAAKAAARRDVWLAEQRHAA